MRATRRKSRKPCRPTERIQRSGCVFQLRGLARALPFPWQEFVKTVDLRAAGHDAFQNVGEILLRVDFIEFAGVDERRQNRPGFAASGTAGEKMIFSAESHHPFILPMSGKNWKSITGGTRILAARLLCVGWSSEQLGNFSECWGPPALWSRWQGGCSIPSSAPEWLLAARVSIWPHSSSWSDC
jgi:hypothetical protein